jgi:type I restriction enzyme S subunit
MIMEEIKMKPSGVNWIGDIPSDWDAIKTKYLTKKVFAGGTPDTSNLYYWENGDIPWLPSGMLQNCTIMKANDFITKKGLLESSAKMIPADVTLIAMTGATCANVGYLTFESSANQSVTAFIKNNKLFSKFLFYSLLVARKEILLSQTGGAQAGINVNDCKNIVIPNCKKEEQQKIADFLDDKCEKIDSVIKETEQQIEVLEKYKKSLITETVTKGLNPNVSMKESGIEWIGQIPKHWEIKKLKHCFEIFNGKEYSDIEIDEGGYPVLGSGGEFARASKFIYNKPSVFIDKPFWSVDTMFFTKMLDNNNAKFMYYVSNCIRFDYYLTSTAVPSMTQKDLGSEIVVCPTLQEQADIANYLDEKCSFIDKTIQEKQQSIETIKNYKNSLIYEYVTGKKRV